MTSTIQREDRETRTLSDIPDRTLRHDHLDRMLTDIGVWQHSAGDVPHRRHGYSIDDEARGLIVGLRYWQQGHVPRFYRRLAVVCFRFLQSAALTEGDQAGRYHNFCDAQGNWLDSIGSDDSFGRTFWGLGVAHSVNAPFAPRSDAEDLLRRSLKAVGDLRYLRSKAFVILGLAASRIDDTLLRDLADELAHAYEATSGSDWQWFEEQMTYCNPRLPQAMFIASEIFPETARYRRIGAESLDFLLKVSRSGTDGYAPIGNAPMEHDGWFKRGQQKPPQFDQQPVDAGALVEACAEAFRVTGEARFREAAHAAFGWYFGNNYHRLPVYNSETGGVADALTRTGISRNQGAESVVSIHLAFQALKTIG